MAVQLLVENQNTKSETKLAKYLLSVHISTSDDLNIFCDRVCKLTWNLFLWNI